MQFPVIDRGSMWTQVQAVPVLGVQVGVVVEVEDTGSLSPGTKEVPGHKRATPIDFSP